MPKHVVVIYVINNIYISIHQIVVLDSRYTPVYQMYHFVFESVSPWIPVYIFEQPVTNRYVSSRHFNNLYYSTQHCDHERAYLYILNNELVKYLFKAALPIVNLHVDRRKEVVKFELSDLLWCIQFLCANVALAGCFSKLSNTTGVWD